MNTTSFNYFIRSIVNVFQIEKAVATLFLILCAAVLIWPTLGWQLPFYYGDTGDARFNMYLLEHSYQFVCRPSSHFWNAPFFYPASEVITYSDNHLGIAPIYTVLRLMGLELETAYQALFLVLIGCNFYAAFWTFKQFHLAVAPALLAAALFTFSIGFDMHWAYTQNWARFAIPPAFYHAWKFGSHRAPKHFLYAALLLVYQFYCSIYAGMLLFFPLLLVGGISTIANFQKWKTSSFRGVLITKLLGIIILSTALLWLLMEPYYRRSLASIPIDPTYIQSNLPTWISWLSATPHSLLWLKIGNLLYVLPNFWSHRLFMGSLATMALLFFWIHPLLSKAFHRFQPRTSPFFPWAIPMALAGFFSFALFTRWGDFAPYMAIIHPLPGFSALRSLNRISSILLFFPALALGFYSHYLLEKLPKRQYAWRTMALVVLLLIDNLPDHHPQDRTPLSHARQRRTYLMKKLSHLPRGTLIGYEPQPLQDHPNDVQLDAMLACQALGLKCLNGYSATAPPGYWEYWERPDELSRSRIFRENHWPELDTLVVIH